MGDFGLQSVAVLEMLDGTDSAFCDATEMGAQPVFARLGFVASFAVPADCGVVGTVFDALLFALALDRWAFVKTGGIGTVLVVSLVLAVVGVGSTFVIGAPGIGVCCGGAGVLDLAEAVGSVVVAVVVVDFSFLEPHLSFLDILLPPTLVTARILVLRTECPVPPKVRISGGGLAPKKKHWQFVLHQAKMCLMFCDCYFVMKFG